MSTHIQGTVARDQIGDFRKECDKLGWLILGTPSKEDSEIRYLDRTMTEHMLLIGDKTDLLILG